MKLEVNNVNKNVGANRGIDVIEQNGEWTIVRSNRYVIVVTKTATTRINEV